MEIKIMPKVETFLNEATTLYLKKISKNSGKSLSKIVSDLVEDGCRITHSREEKKLSTDLDPKSLEYFLRILNINSEILRKLYHEPSNCTKKTANEILAEIKAHAQKRVGTINL